MRFRDRSHAGRALAERLEAYAGHPGLLVLGLPRGGVPVAAEIARALGAPLDVFVVRKLGVPGHEELAMGAIAGGGVRVLNEAVVAEAGIGEEQIARAAAAESAELERRERLYRGERGPVEVAGRTVILVDDGLATGSTMRAAVQAVRAGGPERLAVAVPVAAQPTCDELRPDVDELVCLHTPDPFRAVGLHYEHFDQTGDEEVRELLERSRRPAARVSQRPAGEASPERGEEDGMSTADWRGGSMKLDDIRADLEADDRTLTQRKQAFEHLRRWLRRRPDDDDAKALWARFEDEFGRHHADAPLTRDTSGEGFGALTEAEEKAAKRS